MAKKIDDVCPIREFPKRGEWSGWTMDQKIEWLRMSDQASDYSDGCRVLARYGAWLRRKRKAEKARKDAEYMRFLADCAARHAAICGE